MRQTLLSIVCVCSLVILLCAGCEVTGPAAQKPADPAPVEQVEVDPVTLEAEEYARRLAAAQQAQPPQPVEMQRANNVMWLDPTETMGAIIPATPVQPQEPQAVDATLVSGANTVVDAETLDPVEVQPATFEPRTRSQLVSELLNRLYQSEDDPFAKAMQAVAISLADPHHELDYRLISPLGNQQQEAIQLYHTLLLSLHNQLLEDTGALDRSILNSRLDEVFGQQPISIHNMSLCRRVMGYGIYEPFASTTFLAGQDHRMIVYVELENFRPTLREDEQFSVDLKQEVTLYSADGLAVWRNEPVQINDVSRNQRRDFFVVQLINVPARLGVGKYRLKIRVTDLNGGSIDEQGLDLDFVADTTLVKNAEADPETKPLRQP